jgi:site-specific recombinase XerD
MVPPDRMSPEHVRRYQLHLTRDRRVAWSTFNVNVAALRFFFGETLKVPWEIQEVPYQKRGRRLPVVLSPEEVAALLNVVTNPKHRALLMVMYSAGLRVSETVSLRVGDIDSSRMVVRVEEGKGRKDRYVMLSRTLLSALRDYWRAYRPQELLFPGPDPTRPLRRESVHKVIQRARDRAGITKRVSAHTLRHCFATHLLEAGTNIRVIQRLLGHRSLGTTEVYTHVAGNYLEDTTSPLDALGLGEVVARVRDERS